MDIARCQFCDFKFGHRITDSFDYEIHNPIQITLHSAHKWSKWVVSKFSEIMLHTWYFCNVHMIKRKRDKGTSIADRTEILIPLLCSKTSICQYHYQASHPYNDVEKEYHYYHRPLNTVGMGQNKQDLQCLCSEDVTVLHLATGIFQETHVPLSCNSFTSYALRYCSYHYMPITWRNTFISLYLKYSKRHCFVLSPRLRTIPLPGHYLVSLQECGNSILLF